MTISNQSDSWKKAIICNPKNNLKSHLDGGDIHKNKKMADFKQFIN